MISAKTNLEQDNQGALFGFHLITQKVVLFELELEIVY